MDTKKKTKLALKALDSHLEKYEEFKPSVPKRLKDFWETGEAFKYDGLCLAKETQLPGWDEESNFRLHLVAPMWDAMLLSLDDAVVGPVGDWESAYKYLPIFVGGIQSDFCIVVKLDDEQCPVGFFEEASCLDEDEDLPDGIQMLSPSLDTFLASLTELEADIYMEIDEDSEKQAYYSEDEYFSMIE